MQLSASNLVAPLAELSDARLAKALSSVKPAVAVLVACHCFEVQIRKLAERLGQPASGDHQPLENLIESLPNYALVTPVRRAQWRSIKTWRNEVIHTGALLGQHESQILINEVNQLEKDLESVSMTSDSARG